MTTVKGTGLLVLLGFAAGCAFGLFFGWLLHRERVERALYEDVVRTRDRATSTLAETSARLELANRDMVRLRAQLTDAQHLLAERDATIDELEDELAVLEGHDDHGEPTAGGPVEVVADAATTPDGVRLFDDEDLGDEADITEEVALPVEEGDAAERWPAEEEAGADAPAPADEVEAAAATSVDEEPEAAPGAAASDDVAEPAEPTVEPSVAAHAGDVVVAGAPPATGGVRDVASAASDAPEVVFTEVDAREVDAPEVVFTEVDAREVDAPEVVFTEDVAREVDAALPGPSTPDELRQIRGVGPALERQLHAEGITTFRQLALLDDGAVSELERRRPQLATRLRRGGWIAQARRLHAETHGAQP